MAEQAGLSAGKKKILVVEDDVFITDLLVKELLRAGFELAVATTGGDGAKKFEEFRPDLILLDMLLPDQNGLEVLRGIRRLPAGANAKVIIFSNIAEEADVQESRRLGVADYMVKANYSLPEVIERIHAVLRGDAPENAQSSASS